MLTLSAVGFVDKHLRSILLDVAVGNSGWTGSVVSQAQKMSPNIIVLDDNVGLGFIKRRAQPAVPRPNADPVFVHNHELTVICVPHSKIDVCTRICRLYERSACCTMD